MFNLSDEFMVVTVIRVILGQCGRHNFGHHQHCRSRCGIFTDISDAYNV